MQAPSAISASRRGRADAINSSSRAARVAFTVETMPPPALRDLFVGRARQPHLEFARAVAGIDQMRVAIDQARRDPAALAIDRVRRRRTRRVGLRRRHRRCVRLAPRRRRARQAEARPRRVASRALCQRCSQSHRRMLHRRAPLCLICPLRRRMQRRRPHGWRRCGFNPRCLPEGWAQKRSHHFRRRCDRVGSKPASTPAPDDERHGIAIPGLANVHSHAFQRGMAGLAEVRGPAHDNFWTWREVMYRFLDRLDAGRCAGHRRACLYRDAGKRVSPASANFTICITIRTARLTRTSPNWPSASRRRRSETGIGLTLLPVFYAHGNFGGAAAGAGPAPLHQRSVAFRETDGSEPQGDRARWTMPISASRRIRCAR